MTLPVDEFLRRFLLHLLPPGFLRIRNFGFLANRRRAHLLPLCAQLLKPQVRATRAEPAPNQPPDPTFWKCPYCGGEMKLVERLPPPRSNSALLRLSAEVPREAPTHSSSNLTVDSLSRRGASAVIPPNPIQNP
jgi:hypothetical protein